MAFRPAVWAGNSPIKQDGASLVKPTQTQWEREPMSIPAACGWSTAALRRERPLCDGGLRSWPWPVFGDGGRLGGGPEPELAGRWQTRRRLVGLGWKVSS